MEERTGADGFLVPEFSRTRLASARGILALAVVAALGVLAGCGGGDEDSTEPPRSVTAAQEAPGGRGSDGSDPSASQAQGKGKDTPSSAGGQASPGQGQSKQGISAKLPAGEPEPQATPAEQAQATVADIALSSPALTSGNPPALPAPYTCEGKDSWPALQWQGVPSDTEELILFAMNLAPVNGELFFDWAVAGLDPSLTGIEAGALPRGAIKGTNGFGETGYSICPGRGQSETYVFALHAIPTALRPARGFDPGQLRKEVLAQAGNAGVLVFGYGRG